MLARYVTSLPMICLPLLINGCAGLPDNQLRTPSRYIATIDGRLARATNENVVRHHGLTGFHLLSDGLDAFAARVLLADTAARTIDAQYYLFHDDLTGNILLERLLAAADRGVRVRLLIDDMDTTGRDMDFAALDSHPNFELRLFNPFANRTARLFEMLTRFGRVTRRMHNKSFTVDAAVTLVGGRNIGDEYFSADPSVAFGDLDVLAAGPVAKAVSEVFDDYWNHELAYPARTLVRDNIPDGQLQRLRSRLQATAAEAHDSTYAARVRSSRLVEQLTEKQLTLNWGKAKVFADQPDKLLTSPDDRGTHMGPPLRTEIEGLSEELLIFSPYFVPGRAGVDWLAGLTDRGVRVHILTNSLASNDVGIVHAGYSKYRKELLAAGVDLHEAKAQAHHTPVENHHLGSSSRASLHAKTFVFDRERLFIGSLNLDPRSSVLNTEMGVVIDNAALAGTLGSWFDNQLGRYAYQLRLGDNGGIEWIDRQADGATVHTSEPDTGFLKRLGTWLMRLLPVEGQL